MHAIVIGAGLAGLVAARQLEAGGASVRVLEASSAPGGRVSSRIVDGCVLDRGFQVLFTAYPAVRRHLDLDRLDLRAFRPAAVLMHPDGSRERIGDPVRDPGSLLETLLTPSLGLADKLRIARLAAHVTALPELRPKPAHELLRGDDCTTRSFLRDFGFSDRAIASFFEPFFGGIFLDRALDQSARLFRYYFRMLIQGATAVPAAGMGAIPAQLAEGLDVRCDHQAHELAPDSTGVTVRGSWGESRADAVVVATDPPEATRLTGVGLPTDAVGATYLRYISRESIDREPRILLGLGPGPIDNAVWISNVAPEYAPVGISLLDTIVLDGPAGTNDANEATLDAAVREQLGTWYGAGAAARLELIGYDRVPFAQFAQPPCSTDALPGPHTQLPNVVLASDATRFSSIQGAMEAGEQAAAALLGDARILARPLGA